MEDITQTLGDASAKSLESRVELLLKQLNRYKRVPTGFMQAWETAEQADESSTEGIFLEVGFAAWFAYFLTKNVADSRYHISGKAELGRLIADLERESVESRTLLATTVNSVIPPNVRVKTDSLHEKKKGTMSLNRNIRRRTTNDGTRLPPSSPTCPDQTSTSRRASSSPSTESTHGSSSLSAESTQASSCLSAESNRGQAPSSTSIYYETEHVQVLVNASLPGATSLIPRDLSDAIKRNHDPRNENAMVAAISMTFPNALFTNTYGCQMALEVTTDKVAHLALVLFQARLEIKSGLRYVCLAGGSKVLPNPKFTLQGCHLGPIPSTFGLELSTAIGASPIYADDVKQFRDCTDGVSMVISCDANEGADIYIALGMWEGVQISKKLYS